MIVAIVEFLLDDENQLIRRTMHRFSSSVDLEEGWNKLKVKSGVQLYAVNCSKPTPPPGEYVAIKGTHWCPYCADTRHFDYSSSTESEHCNVCGISENDYYVRRFNNHYYVKHCFTDRDRKRNDHNRRRDGQHREDDSDRGDHLSP